MIQLGSRGAGVERLQDALGITLDGIFGPKTDKALRAFQRDNNLVADGILGPKTLAALNGDDTTGSLRQSEIDKAASTLCVDRASVLAINEVESRGRGYFRSGDPAILFERHIMYRRLKRKRIDPEYWHQRWPDIVNPRPGGYVGGQQEHTRLDDAKDIDIASAIESASWGAFQIMGMHWQRLDYASAEDFEQRMRSGDEADHFDAFVRFIQADDAILEALRQRDWAAFARRYNGPNYAENKYHIKLAVAYQRHLAG